jgi:hypothetical protein
MNITKRDIADISLVWIALHFVPWLLNHAVYAIYAVCEFLRPTAEAPGPQGFSQVNIGVFSNGLSVFNIVGQFCVLAAFFWFLLFKREYILDRLFPNSDEKTLALSPDSAMRLTEYSFWITLFGLFTGIHAGINLISNLTRVLGGHNNSMGHFAWFWSLCGLHIVSVILSALVLWKAEKIADFFDRSDKPSPASGRSESVKVEV